MVGLVLKSMIKKIDTERGLKHMQKISFFLIFILCSCSNYGGHENFFRNFSQEIFEGMETKFIVKMTKPGLENYQVIIKNKNIDQEVIKEKLIKKEWYPTQNCLNDVKCFCYEKNYQIRLKNMGDGYLVGYSYDEKGIIGCK